MTPCTSAPASPFRIMSLAALVRNDEAVARALTASSTEVFPVPLGENRTVTASGSGSNANSLKRRKLRSVSSWRPTTATRLLNSNGHQKVAEAHVFHAVNHRRTHRSE